jgi:tRNA nucleotidyltransferase (CCA-adding enzyme)
LRFAAVLDFQLEEKTRAAIHKNCERLRDISAERIAVELTGLLCGKNMGKIFLEETRVLGVVVPEILPAEGFDQRNHHHCHDVLTHTIIAMENVPPLPRLRWAMLFHDLGKPEAFSLDEAGVGHFYGHSKISEGLARERLTALRIDKTTIDQVCKLIKYHDTPIVADERIVKRWLNRLSEPLFRDLLKIKRGDNLAQAYRDRLAELDKLEALLNKVIREQACFSLKDLAVKGDDLMALGIEKGPEIGRILNQLLEGVMDEAYENKKNVLIEKAKELQTC